VATEALREIESLAGDEEVVEAELSKGMDALKADHFREFESLTRRLQDKQITRAAFDQASHDLISRNFEKAYSLNIRRTLSDGDLEYLSRAVTDEMKYARQFGRDIEAGALRMPRVQRAGMYGNTLDGIGTHALVEREPDDVRIYWKLGDAEHCVDCLILASQSPYTKLDLPTTPRAGATQCVSNCRCRLVFKRGKLSREERADIEEYGRKKEQGLSELLEGPEPPPGWRRPSPEERVYIDDLRTRMNHQRRRMASKELSPGEVKRATSLRKKLNAELIEFEQKNKIYDVPIWSVDDVLSERDIGRRALRDIFRHGLDGRSLDAVGKARLRSLLGAHESEFKELFDEKTIRRVKSKRMVPRKPKKEPVPVKPEEGPVEFDTEPVAKRFRWSKNRIKAGKDLDKRDQEFIREQFDGLFEKAGMVDRAGKNTVRPGRVRKEINVAKGLRGGADGVYDYQTGGRISVTEKVFLDAEGFFAGKRTKVNIEGGMVFFHETAHAHSRLVFGRDGGYAGLGIVLEEGTADLVAIRMMRDSLGIDLQLLVNRVAYDEYLDKIFKEVGDALVKAYAKINKNVVKKGMDELRQVASKKGWRTARTEMRDKVFDMVSDASIKLRSEGELITNWGEYVKEFTNSMDLTDELVAMLDVDDLDDFAKAFSDELKGNMNKWKLR
jgi:hypothetical protein